MQTLLHLTFPNTHTGHTERLILLLLYNTGMRLSELLYLQESQIDSHYCQIKVLGKRNKERIIPISKYLLQQLLEYIEQKPREENNEGRVFVNKKGKPLYDKYIYNLVKKISWRSNYTAQKKSARAAPYFCHSFNEQWR